MPVPRDAVEAANLKTDDQFVSDYLQLEDQCWSRWTHVATGHEYRLSLTAVGRLSDSMLDDCLGLVEETSGADYRVAAIGWNPAAKQVEMRTPGLRYLLVRDSSGSIRGFLSVIPTHDDGRQVLYCYEIHLRPELRGSGLGSLLMRLAHRIADFMPPIEAVVLTCFTRNRHAMAFYRRLGFVLDRTSPRPRTLRGRRTAEPDHVILSRPVTGTPVADSD